MNTNLCKQSLLSCESILFIVGRATWSILLLTMILGILYPIVMTDAARMLFPKQAAGSVLTVNGKAVGSELIGQDFSKTPYFHSRPSATAKPYDASTSGGSNFAAGNEKLTQQIAQREKYWHRETGSKQKVPADLLTSSSSGLDPHISLDAALYQVPVVARKTGLSVGTLNSLIEKHTEHGLFGGPEFVNVLILNLDVQRLHLAHKVRKTKG